MLKYKYNQAKKRRMCLSPVKKKNFSNKKNWLVKPVNSIKNLNVE